VNLRGQTFIVTGASRGIGAAIAKGLAGLGVNLVLNARSEGALEQTAADCKVLGVQVRTVAGDCATDQTAQFMVKAAKVIGNFSGFIHNAGVLHPGPTLWELSETQFDEIFNTNVKAGFLLAKYTIPNLRRSGGGFAVFVGSGAANYPVAGWAAYSAAKAAEHALAFNLALEAPEIYTFVYSPGTVDTAMQQAGRETSGDIAQMFQGFKNGGLLTPEYTAGKLLVALQDDSRRFHGKVASHRDV
jgi:NAD(P)-dependent dehydrogenase (short-subunit alcohol dehydrogenase family)